MKKETVKRAEVMLIGLTARTANKREFDPATSKIGPLTTVYWGTHVADHFKHRINPGVTYAAYTDYESDENGEYTYFIGEAVQSLEGQDLSKFTSLIIPASRYVKFTTDTGKMPDVVINAWQAIWQMNSTDLGGKRQYLADFEIYDQRAHAPDKAVVDIYIGIQ